MNMNVRTMSNGNSDFSSRCATNHVTYLQCNTIYNSLQYNTCNTSIASGSGAQRCDDAEKSTVVASREQFSF